MTKKHEFYATKIETNIDMLILTLAKTMHAWYNKYNLS